MRRKNPKPVNPIKARQEQLARDVAAERYNKKRKTSSYRRRVRERYTTRIIYTPQHLMNVIAKVGAEQGCDILEHYVKEAYKDHKVLISLMGKILPDLTLDMIQSIMHPGMTDGEANQVMRALRQRIETSLGAPNSTENNNGNSDISIEVET